VFISEVTRIHKVNQGRENPLDTSCETNSCVIWSFEGFGRKLFTILELTFITSTP